MLKKLLALFHREEGQDMIEYALITTGLSVAIIAAIVLGGIPAAFTAWAADIVGRI